MFPSSCTITTRVFYLQTHPIVATEPRSIRTAKFQLEPALLTTQRHHGNLPSACHKEGIELYTLHTQGHYNHTQHKDTSIVSFDSEYIEKGRRENRNMNSFCEFSTLWRTLQLSLDDSLNALCHAFTPIFCAFLGLTFHYRWAQPGFPCFHHPDFQLRRKKHPNLVTGRALRNTFQDSSSRATNLYSERESFLTLPSYVCSAVRRDRYIPTLSTYVQSEKLHSRDKDGFLYVVYMLGWYVELSVSLCATEETIRAKVLETLLTSLLSVSL